MKLSQQRIEGILSNPAKREDLVCMQNALDLGFEPHQEIGAEDVWPVRGEQSISFVKNEKTIWFAPHTKHGVGPKERDTYSDPWRCADLIDGRYCNHRAYDSLLEALTAEGV